MSLFLSLSQKADAVRKTRRKTFGLGPHWWSLNAHCMDLHNDSKVSNSTPSMLHCGTESFAAVVCGTWCPYHLLGTVETFTCFFCVEPYCGSGYSILSPPLQFSVLLSIHSGFRIIQPTLLQGLKHETIPFMSEWVSLCWIRSVCMCVSVYVCVSEWETNTKRG